MWGNMSVFLEFVEEREVDYVVGVEIREDVKKRD